MRPWVSVPDVNPFRRFGRLAWLAVRAPQLPPIDPQHVGRVQRRVMLGDIDELRHMNNGVYLSMLDHARQELVVRTGDAAVAGSLVSEEVLDDDEAREDLALAVEVRGVVEVAVLRKSSPISGWSR